MRRLEARLILNRNSYVHQVKSNTRRVHHAILAFPHGTPPPSKWEGANKSNRPTPGGGCYRSLTRGYPLLAPNGAAKCRASRGQNELGRGVKNTPARGHLLLWQGERDVLVA